MRTLPARNLVAAALLLASAGVSSQAEPTVRVAVAQERISVHVEDATVGAVLDEIARQTGLEVHLPDALAGRALNVSFDGLTMEQALARLLVGMSHVLQRADGAGGTGPWRVWVLSSGTGQAPAAVASGAGAQDASRLAFDARNASDPAVRSAALAALSVEDPARFAAVLPGAFSDGEQEVRETALDLLAYASEDDGPPRETKLALLGQVARADPAASLRVEALALIAELAPERARGLALELREDPDEEVRNEARALLENLADTPAPVTPQRQ